MDSIQEDRYMELKKLIYYELPMLLQKISCSSYQYVGYDGIEEDFNYIEKYVDEARRVANLTLDGQLATLKNIIIEK